MIAFLLKNTYPYLKEDIMKKSVKLLSLVAVLILVLTGCSTTKELTCTANQSSNGIKMEQKVVMTFKDDKINRVVMTVNSKADSDIIKNNWSTFASMMQSQFKAANKDGLKLTTKNDNKNKTFIVEIAVDVKKAKQSDLKTYNLEDLTKANSTYKETKKDAEASGFTCK